MVRYGIAGAVAGGIVAGAAGILAGKELSQMLDLGSQASLYVPYVIAAAGSAAGGLAGLVYDVSHGSSGLHMGGSTVQATTLPADDDFMSIDDSLREWFPQYDKLGSMRYSREDNGGYLVAFAGQEAYVKTDHASYVAVESHGIKALSRNDSRAISDIADALDIDYMEYEEYRIFRTYLTTGTKDDVAKAIARVRMAEIIFGRFQAEAWRRPPITPDEKKELETLTRKISNSLDMYGPQASVPYIP